MTLRTGRFGPYVQLGEGADDRSRSARRIPKGIDAATIDLERALQLLSLPREVGLHPEGGTDHRRARPLRAVHPARERPTYANVDSIEEVFTIGVNRAVTLLAEKKAGKGGRFGKGAPAKQF